MGQVSAQPEDVRDLLVSLFHPGKLLSKDEDGAARWLSGGSAGRALYFLYRVLNAIARWEVSASALGLGGQL